MIANHIKIGQFSLHNSYRINNKIYCCVVGRYAIWQVFFLFLNNMIRLRVFGCKQFHDNLYLYFNSIRKRSNRIDDVYLTLMHQIGSLDSFIQLLKYSVVLGCVPPFWKEEILFSFFLFYEFNLIDFFSFCQKC